MFHNANQVRIFSLTYITLQLEGFRDRGDAFGDTDMLTNSLGRGTTRLLSKWPSIQAHVHCANVGRGEIGQSRVSESLSLFASAIPNQYSL